MALLESDGKTPRGAALSIVVHDGEIVYGSIKPLRIESGDLVVVRVSVNTQRHLQRVAEALQPLLHKFPQGAVPIILASDVDIENISGKQAKILLEKLLR